jgi:hypothetical protein
MPGFYPILDVTVLCGHGDRGMAKRLLDHFDVARLLVELRSAGMPQRMTGEYAAG